MWVGGYDDWTPAEQREWDRDLEELEGEREECEKQNEQNEQKEQSEQKESKTWMDMALDDPLFKATFTRLGDTNAYIAELQHQTPRQLGDRNLVFEVVHPLYQGLNTLLQQRATPQTSTIRIQVSSREHVGVSYTCYCTPETWSYTVMDEILEGLNDQLTMKQNLNRGLLLQLSFIKKSS